jgi:hypothetical protein
MIIITAILHYQRLFSSNNSHNYALGKLKLHTLYVIRRYLRQYLQTTLTTALLTALRI